MERSGSEGTRDIGVGWQVGTPGSGSGGDVDTDVIGVGTDGGLAANPPERTNPSSTSGNTTEEEDVMDDVESRYDENKR